jgi:hypothetical protein
MTYLPTSADYLDQIIGLWAFIVIIASIVAIVKYRKKTKLAKVTADAAGMPFVPAKLGKNAIIVSIVAVAGLLGSGIYANIAEAKIKENFLANLTSKYDIQEVDTPLGGYPSKGKVGKPGIVYVGDARAQVIKVTANGQSYDFVVRQDVLTFEPTLYDVPADLKEFRSQRENFPVSMDAEFLKK